MPVFILFILFIFFSLPVQAAPQSPSVYRQLGFEAGYPWNAGLILTLNPDEAACKKNYGSQWRVKCASPFRQYGQPAKGIKLYPEARGRWEWQGSSIAFIPADENALKPATTYKADITSLYLPPSVVVDKKQVACATAPLAAKPSSLKFMLDPSRHAKHRLIASLDFNYPLADEKWLPLLQLPQGATSGQAEAVWNGTRDKLTVSWPIFSLPEKDSMAAINLGEIGQILESGNEITILPAAKNGFVLRQNLPAKDNIFKIKGINLERRKDGALNNIFVLSVNTSLHANPADIMRNLIVLELPKYKSDKSTVAYDWSHAPFIPRNIKTRKLQNRLLNNEHLPAGKFEFEIPVEAGRYVMVIIEPGLPSCTGIQLKNPWFGIAHASNLTSAIGFRDMGNLLPSGAELGLYGNDLDSIRWEIRSVDKPFLGLMAQTSSQPFTFPLERLEESGVGVESLGELVHGEILLPPASQGTAQFANLDISSALVAHNRQPAGLFHITLRGMQKDKHVAEAKRLILVTDLALVAKVSSDGSLDGFARYLKEQKPASDALVSILGANGKPIIQGRTDKEGHVVFPSLNTLAKESKPVAIIAEAGNDLSWMSLLDKSRELDYSEFAAGGARAASDNTMVYLFNERGMYRPGDTLNFGCMIRKGNFATLPEDVPFYAELLDPRGLRIWETHFRAGAEGMAELSCPTDPSFLSGRYALNIRPARKGAVLATSAIQLEEFQPDLLKIKVETPKTKGWLLSGRENEINVKLQNLYGTPATDNRINAKYSLAPAKFSFKGYEDYTFADPAPFAGNGSESNMGEKRTGKNGSVTFTLPETLGKKASARVTVMATGFDRSGGRACGDAASLLISPFDRILGWKPVGALTNPGFIARDAEAAIHFTAINNELLPAEMKGLNFSLGRRGQIVNLISDGEGGYRYDDVPQEVVIKTWQDSIPAKGKTIVLPVAEPGDFILSVTDKNGNSLARIPYSVMGDSLAAPEHGANASKMRLRLDRVEYNQGDKIQAAFTLPYDGMGLFCIEREGIKSFKWVHAHAGDNMTELEVPEALEGKGYVTATFMRSLASGNLYLEPLAYAVAPFTANVATRKQGLTMHAPRNIRPGEKLIVTLKAKKPGKAILIAVDEGILQLGRHKNPDPLAALLKDRALDVKTLQTGDLLLPFNGKDMYRHAAFGGGMDAGSFGQQFRNPFKRRSEPPLVFWSGLMDINTSPAEISIPVPPWYAGSVRLMAVSAARDSMDSAITQVEVIAPLVLTPVLPLTVAPGDKFQGALILANTTEQPLQVNAALSAPAAIKLTSFLPGMLRLAPGQEDIIKFDAEALDEIGEHLFTFKAMTGKEEYSRQAGMVIRPASALRTTVQSGKTQGSLEVDQPRSLYPALARISVSLSTLPAALGQSLASFLDTYPYGCTEQLISRSLAQLAMPGLPESGELEQKRQKLFEATLQAIRGRFSYGHGVALWPDGEPNLLLTAYALDYLLAMREAGFGAPPDLLDSLAEAITWNLASNDLSLSSARAAAYSIWVLARTGRIVTQNIEELLAGMKERGLHNWKNDLICLLLAAAKREMQVPINLDFSSIVFAPEGWFDHYAQLALAARIQAEYFPDSPQTMAEQFVEETINTVNSANFSTFSSAQAINSLVAISSKNTPTLQQAAISCAGGEKGGEYELTGNMRTLGREMPLCARYKIKAPDTVLPLYWQITTSGYDRDLPHAEKDNGIEITRQYLNDRGEVVSNARQGEEISVRITARASGEAINNAVISDLLPGGFEMIMPARNPTLPENMKWIDRREDRMLIFADLDSTGLDFSFRVRAVTPGDYTAPAISAEGMYHPAINGHGAAARFRIEAQ